MKYGCNIQLPAMVLVHEMIFNGAKAGSGMILFTLQKGLSSLMLLHWPGCASVKKKKEIRNAVVRQILDS